MIEDYEAHLDLSNYLTRYANEKGYTLQQMVSFSGIYCCGLLAGNGSSEEDLEKLFIVLRSIYKEMKQKETHIEVK